MVLPWHLVNKTKPATRGPHGHPARVGCTRPQRRAPPAPPRVTRVHPPNTHRRRRPARPGRSWRRSPWMPMAACGPGTFLCLTASWPPWAGPSGARACGAWGCMAAGRAWGAAAQQRGRRVPHACCGRTTAWRRRRPRAPQAGGGHGRGLEHQGALVHRDRAASGDVVRAAARRGCSRCGGAVCRRAGADAALAVLPACSCAACGTLGPACAATAVAASAATKIPPRARAHGSCRQGKRKLVSARRQHGRRLLRAASRHGGPETVHFQGPARAWPHAQARARRRRGEGWHRCGRGGNNTRRRIAIQYRLVDSAQWTSH